MNRYFVACVFALLFGVSPGYAQQGTTEVRGRVVDPQGALLPGVTVTVRNQDTGMFRETVSNSDGTFLVTGIVPGRYEISAELQGFKKFMRKDMELEIGKTATIDVPLEVGQLSETVNVSAESPTRGRDLEGDRRQHHDARARRAAEHQRQLRRVHRPAARHRARRSAPSRSAAIRSR